MLTDSSGAARTPDLCVLGAGSLGTALGGVLALGGLGVVLVSRRAEHVAAIRRDGLVVADGTGERVARLQARTDCTGMAPVPLLLVLVKAPDTAAALAGAQHVVGPDTLVLTLQNGLGAEQILADRFGARRVAAGRTWVGGELQSPGRVFAGVTGKRTVIGELDGPVSPRVRAVADAWTGAGIPTEVSPDITGVIWDKLLTNVATGALAAITGLGYGPLYSVPELEATGQAAVREALAVAAAAGVRVSATDALAVWRGAGAGLGADFRASMLQSLDAGRRTEIDFVNGAVCRLGAQLGVPTPVNDTLVAAVRGRERAVLGDPQTGPAVGSDAASTG